MLCSLEKLEDTVQKNNWEYLFDMITEWNSANQINTSESKTLDWHKDTH
jgi:hypothetical protein